MILFEIDEHLLRKSLCRVVSAVLLKVSFGGVPEVAPVLGVSETTVRTHLRHLFEKTGASRQADLVKIVAAFTNPLVA